MSALNPRPSPATLAAAAPSPRLQLIALRYGTVPVVRETSGLADTVLDLAPGRSSTAPQGQRVACGERDIIVVRMPCLERSGEWVGE